MGEHQQKEEGGKDHMIKEEDGTAPLSPKTRTTEEAMSNTGEDERTSPLKGLGTESSSDEDGTSSYQRGWETPGLLRNASAIVEEHEGGT